MDSRAVPQFARPVLDLDESDFDIAGELATYRKARIRALTIGPTDANVGWSPLALGKAGEGPPATGRRARWQ